MSEPKLTVGRVQTWQDIDGRPIAARFPGYKDAVCLLVESLNRRMRELFPPAPPQPEAKAEPDYTCPKCGEDTAVAGRCCHSRPFIVAAANARIAELTRERDEALEAADLIGEHYAAIRAAMHPLPKEE